MFWNVGCRHWLRGAQVGGQAASPPQIAGSPWTAWWELAWEPQALHPGARAELGRLQPSHSPAAHSPPLAQPSRPALPPGILCPFCPVHLSRPSWLFYLLHGPAQSRTLAANLWPKHPSFLLLIQKQTDAWVGSTSWKILGAVLACCQSVGSSGSLVVGRVLGPASAGSRPSHGHWSGLQRVKASVGALFHVSVV